MNFVKYLPWAKKRHRPPNPQRRHFRDDKFLLRSLFPVGRSLFKYLTIPFTFYHRTFTLFARQTFSFFLIMPPRHSDLTFEDDFAYREGRHQSYALAGLDELSSRRPSRQIIQDSPSIPCPTLRELQLMDRIRICKDNNFEDDDKFRKSRTLNNRQQKFQEHWKPLPPLTICLPLLNLIDMMAVALVVPLLVQYYKAAGVTSASQREMLSSLFSSSQILGGLLWGALSDSGLLRRRSLLLISFAGSALSYLMIVHGAFATLVVSRVLVGFVKQTVTVTTSMLTQCTTKETRAAHMGRSVTSLQ